MMGAEIEYACLFWYCCSLCVPASHHAHCSTSFKLLTGIVELRKTYKLLQILIFCMQQRRAS